MCYNEIGDIMDIKLGSNVTLSDGIEYIVISKTNFKDKEYYYLINMKDNQQSL